MFRLIIVDDERKTRESIEKYIPWNELGVAEVKTAKDGLEALKYPMLLYRISFFAM